MPLVRHVCCIVTFLLAAVWFAGLDAARLKRQTSGNGDTPFLQDLQKLAKQNPAQTLTGNGANLNNIMESVRQALGSNSQGLAGQGQTVDLDSLMQLTENVQQIGEDMVEFTLNEGDPNHPNSPEVSVVVETLSAEDLLASEKGRQQLSQLNAQLEQAMNSLDQSVQMMQDPNLSVEAMFAGIVNMLTGGESGHMFLGVMETQSLQAVKQLMETLDQLPNLKALLEKFYRFVEHLHTCGPSTAKDVQQLIANAAMSFQGMNGGLGQGGAMMGTENMLELALKGLNANLQLLEVMVNEMPQMVHNPTFLLVVNDTHCMVRGLTGDLSTDIAAGCVQHLMQAITMVNESEHMITDFSNSLIYFMSSPHVLQSFADFMKMPSLDKAFVLVYTIMGYGNETNSNLVTVIQALQTMLRTLLKNQPLLETLANLVQNPDSSQVYENAMQFLKNTTLGDTATQQLLRVVNDSITRLLQNGSVQMAVEKIQEILTVLKNEQDPTQPLNEAQQALLDLVSKLLKVAQNAVDSETTTTQPANTTTLKPVDTSPRIDTTESATVTATTTSSVTTRSVSSTRSSPSQTTGDGKQPSLPPRTTTMSETEDDSGSGFVPLSASTLIIILMASVIWI